VIVKIQELEPHAAEWSFGKGLFRLLYEFLTVYVLVVVRVPHHIQEKQIGPAVAIQVGEARVSAPAPGMQANFRSNILETIVAHVLVQDGVFETVGMHMSVKRVAQAHVLAVSPLFVAGVPAYVAHQEIKQSVVVVVEENGA